MPLLSISTNVKLNNETAEKLITSASKLVAETLGKPESYVMVRLENNPYMVFAGNNKPLLYAELKSIGLPENKTSEISHRLTDFFTSEMKISADRIYIEFANAESHMWGWNGSTF